jgi:selenocysteine-specific elongation factor
LKQIILGTAGHIDHGKTSLIKAMTGIDTDRLKEEKERGITIELGFASINLPSGQHLGIIDVPGHEKFVKNMVAGATGIDIVSMVIAADEGVMPQTKEHMEICSLLGIEHGVIALTKTDMVEEDWLELVTEDIREFVEGTFLEDAPIIPVSSTKGTGIKEFGDILDQLCESIPERSISSLFRLPVDRVFTMKGFGTVITGSLISGTVNVGDNIMVYPSKTVSKVRGIQFHGESVEAASSGMRTAINFQGLDKELVNRGDIVSTEGALKPSYLLDGNIHFLKSNLRPAKTRTKVRFHIGTSEITGNLVLLDRDELMPGDDAVVQIRLDTPVSCVKDDKFVIRSFSPVKTIAGGSVVNPIPPKHKRFRDKIIDGLNKVVGGDINDILIFHTAQSGYRPLAFNDLKLMTNLTDKKLNGEISAHLAKKSIVQVDKDQRLYISGEIFKELSERTVGIIEKFHESNPLKETMKKEEVKSKLPDILGSRLFNMIITQLQKDGVIVHESDSVRLSNHKVALQIDQEEVRGKIIDQYEKSKLSPPYFKAFCEENGYDNAAAKDVLHVLVNEGTITRVKDDLFYHCNNIESLKVELNSYLIENGEITTPQFKEMTGASRKYVIPLIEYFDSINFTIRVGDVRQLRKRS